MASSIEWLVGPDGSQGETWNTVEGCTPASTGCLRCYAAAQASREMCEAHKGLTRKIRRRNRAGKLVSLPVFNGTVRLVPERLIEPLHWRKPRRAFVDSMSDLFHKDVPDGHIARVFAVMALARAHTFLVLTKRAERLASVVGDEDFKDEVLEAIGRLLDAGEGVAPEGWSYFRQSQYHSTTGVYLGSEGWWEGELPWPLPNVHLGVSAEDQATFDDRVPLLLKCPAAVRWVSAEPLLGPINCEDYVDELGPLGSTEPPLDWVVVGGESGPGARPCHVDWIRSLLRQCCDAGVPAFCKQLGRVVHARNDEIWGYSGFGDDMNAWPGVEPDDIEENINGFREEYQGAPVRVRLKDSKGKEPSEWPADLRVRELPEVPT